MSTYSAGMYLYDLLNQFTMYYGWSMADFSANDVPLRSIIQQADGMLNPDEVDAIMANIRVNQIDNLNWDINSVYIPVDPYGNPIPLVKQTVMGQGIPLPDPNAQGPHTVLGGKTSEETGELYRQSATFPAGTWPAANGQNVPWSEVHWSNHGRPQDHHNPHQHMFSYDESQKFWKRQGPSNY